MSKTADPAITALLKRAARELWDGCYVNLGIGLPSQLLSYIDPTIQPFIHSENGVLGAWKQASRAQMDPMLIDAGGTYVSTIAGSSFFDSATSFAIIRRGRLDLCMLGAFEVDSVGNLANWKIPHKYTPGIGGAMELAQKAQNLIVLMRHLDKRGRSKIKQHCTLPLTAKNCVKRIITDKAVLDVTANGLLVQEMAHGVERDALCAVTDAELQFAANVGIF